MWNTKRIVCSLLSLLLAGALLAGCDAAAEGVDSDAGDFPKGEMTGGPGGGMSGGTPEDMAMPEDGETAKASAEPEILSENQTQIVGKVLSVVGNEVELALGSYGGSGNEKAAPGSGADSSGTLKEKPSGAPEGGGEKPAATPEAGTASGETESIKSDASTESGGRRSGAESFKENGVTQTLLIPVGLALSGSGGGQRSRDYSSVTAGMVLRITLETLDDGSETVISVRVLAS